MQHTHKLAVIDSGAGGISILMEILTKVLPQDCIYVADHAGFPYGILDETTLLYRLTGIVQHLVSHYQTMIIVVACNTASTLALDDLRSRFPEVQFVGVVPAIKPATQLSKTKHIGVLATPATVVRQYTHNLVTEFASDCHVSFWGSTYLVELAENFMTTEKVDEKCLMQELDKLLEQDRDIDTIVLACTHFPLIKSFIQKCAKQLCAIHGRHHQIHIIDSGEAIARRVASIAERLDTDRPDKERPDKESPDNKKLGLNKLIRKAESTPQKTPIYITYISTSYDQKQLQKLANNYDRHIQLNAHYLIQSQTLHLELT